MRGLTTHVPPSGAPLAADRGGALDEVLVARVPGGGTRVGDEEVEAEVLHGVAEGGVELGRAREGLLVGARLRLVHGSRVRRVPRGGQRRPDDDRGLRLGEAGAAPRRARPARERVKRGGA